MESTQSCGSVKKCPLCEYYSPSLVLYVSHLRLVHSHDPSFRVSCDLGGCEGQVFRAFSAFNSHVYRRHRVALGLEKDDVSSEVEHDPGPSHASQVLDEHHFINPEDEELSDELPDTMFASGRVALDSDNLHYLKSNAEFLMTLSEGKMLSQVAVDSVITGCRSICEQVLSQVKQNVTSKLLDAQLDPSSIAGLELALTCVADPFEGIDTPYLRDKFYKEHFHFLVSNNNICSCRPPPPMLLHT